MSKLKDAKEILKMTWRMMRDDYAGLREDSDWQRKHNTRKQKVKNIVVNMIVISIFIMLIYLLIRFKVGIFGIWGVI